MDKFNLLKLTRPNIYLFAQDFLKDFANVSKDFLEFSLLTQKVEAVDLSVFESLQTNDILFVEQLLRSNGCAAGCQFN